MVPCTVLLCPVAVGVGEYLSEFVLIGLASRLVVRMPRPIMKENDRAQLDRPVEMLHDVQQEDIGKQKPLIVDLSQLLHELAGNDGERKKVFVEPGADSDIEDSVRILVGLFNDQLGPVPGMELHVVVATDQ